MDTTKKQQQEIDFFSTVWDKFTPTDEEISEYIQSTVHGLKVDQRNSCNRLIRSKRQLDINIKMWRQDMCGNITNGTPILFSFELKNDFNHPYFNRVLKSIINGLPNFYRDWQTKCLGDND